MKTKFVQSAMIAMFAPLSFFALAQSPGPGQEKTVTVPSAEPIPTAGQALKQGAADLGLRQEGVTPLQVDPKDKMQSKKSFVEEVDMTAMAVLAQSRLASQRASDPQVKALAETLIADHTAMAPKITSLASKLKADDIEKLDLPRETVVSNLAKLNGVKFDEAYIEQIVHDSDNTVAFYKAMAKDSKNDDVRAFVSESLPMVERHRDRATALYKKSDKDSSARK